MPQVAKRKRVVLDDDDDEFEDNDKENENENDSTAATPVTRVKSKNTEQKDKFNKRWSPETKTEEELLRMWTRYHPFTL